MERTRYNFAMHTRMREEQEMIYPGEFVIVEGIFALCCPELLPIYSLRIYIDTPDCVCFARRLRRDVMERGRTPESVREQYDATVRQANMHWVRPSLFNSDIVLNGTNDLDRNVERVIAELSRPVRRISTLP